MCESEHHRVHDSLTSYLPGSVPVYGEKKPSLILNPILALRLHFEFLPSSNVHEGGGWLPGVTQAGRADLRCEEKTLEAA